MDVSGNVLDYEQFCTKHIFNPAKSDLHKALPKQIVFLTKNIMAHQPIQPPLASLSIQGILILDKYCNNYLMRNCLTEKIFPGRQNKNKILNKFDKNSVDRLRTMYLTFPIPPKMKETHLKIMNNIHPSKELLLLGYVSISMTIYAHFVRMILKLRAIYFSHVVWCIHSGFTINKSTAKYSYMTS